MYRRFKSIQKIKLVADTALTFFDKIKVYYCYVLLSLKVIFGMRPRLTGGRKITFCADGHCFSFLLKDKLDFNLLYDALVAKEYAIESSEDVKVVFDLGSNVGLTVLIFYHKFPDAQIFAFEPDPNNFIRLSENVAMLSDPSRVTLYENAVYDKDGETLTLHSSEDRHWSSSLQERVDCPDAFPVQSITLDRVIDEKHIESIDVMKFDIEGAEYDVFNSFNQRNIVSVYLGEVHPSLMPVSTENFLEIFKSYKIEISKENSDVVTMRKK